MENISLIKSIFYNLTGIVSVLFVFTSAAIGYPFILTASLIKLITFKPSRKICTKILIMISTRWIHNNTFLSDLPFMKRYTAEFISKYPHLKSKDIEITKKACEKFSTTPVFVMNFVEGTRFTEEKDKRQKPPLRIFLNRKPEERVLFLPRWDVSFTAF